MAKIITEFPSRLSPVRILATVLALTLSLGCEKNDTDTGDNGGSSANQGSQPNSNQSVTQQPDSSSELTLAQYSAVKQGMSLNDVNGILGGGVAVTIIGSNTKSGYWSRGITYVCVYFKDDRVMDSATAGYEGYKNGGVRSKPGEIVSVLNDEIIAYNNM